MATLVHVCNNPHTSRPSLAANSYYPIQDRLSMCHHAQCAKHNLCACKSTSNSSQWPMLPFHHRFQQFSLLAANVASSRDPRLVICDLRSQSLFFVAGGFLPFSLAWYTRLSSKLASDAISLLYSNCATQHVHEALKMNVVGL